MVGMAGIAAFVGVGGFLLGYDVGIIGGVLAMDSFQEVFKYNDWSKVRAILKYMTPRECAMRRQTCPASERSGPIS